MFTAMLMPSIARAEYRVYEYILKNKIPTNDEAGKIIRSTLNPRGFVAYHGGNNLIKIDLVRTWMCAGATNQRKLCLSPYEELTMDMIKELP